MILRDVQFSLWRPVRNCTSFVGDMSFVRGGAQRQRPVSHISDKNNVKWTSGPTHSRGPARWDFYSEIKKEM